MRKLSLLETYQALLRVKAEREREIREKKLELIDIKREISLIRAEIDETYNTL